MYQPLRLLFFSRLSGRQTSAAWIFVWRWRAPLFHPKATKTETSSYRGAENVCKFADLHFSLIPKSALQPLLIAAVPPGMPWPWSPALPCSDSQGSSHHWPPISLSNTWKELTKARRVNECSACEVLQKRRICVVVPWERTGKNIIGDICQPTRKSG